VGESAVWVMCGVAALIGWIVYSNSRDKDRARDRNSQLVAELSTESRYSGARVRQLNPDIYDIPILEHPEARMDGYDCFLEITETWHFAEQDAENIARKVDGRFPIWMFLLREHDNPYYTDAIAVYSWEYATSADGTVPWRGNRQIGYLGESDARLLAPLLDQFPLTRVPVRIGHVSDGYRLECLAMTPELLAHKLNVKYNAPPSPQAPETVKHKSGDLLGQPALKRQHDWFRDEYQASSHDDWDSVSGASRAAPKTEWDRYWDSIGDSTAPRTLARSDEEEDQDGYDDEPIDAPSAADLHLSFASPFRSGPTGFAAVREHVLQNARFAAHISKTPSADMHPAMVFPTNRFIDDMLVDGESVWLFGTVFPDEEDEFGLVTRVRTNDSSEYHEQVRLGPHVRRPILAGEHVWVTDDSCVSVIRRSDASVAHAIPVIASDLVFGDAHVWASNQTLGTVTKIRAKNAVVVDTFEIGEHPHRLLFDGRSIWVTDRDSLDVRSIHLADGVAAGSIELTDFEHNEQFGPPAQGPIFAAGRIWYPVHNEYDSSYVQAMDPNNPDDLLIIHVRDKVNAITFDGKHVWAATEFGALFKINPTTGEMLAAVQLPAQPSWVVSDGFNLWFTSSPMVDAIARSVAPQSA
jgi:hypothetical protein